MGKRLMKWDGRITLPVINCVLRGGLHDDVYVDDKSFAMLLKIQRMLEVFPVNCQ
jgi:hypothetical protein